MSGSDGSVVCLRLIRFEFTHCLVNSVLCLTRNIRDSARVCVGNIKYTAFATRLFVEVDFAVTKSMLL